MGITITREMASPADSTIMKNVSGIWNVPFHMHLMTRVSVTRRTSFLLTGEPTHLILSSGRNVCLYMLLSTCRFGDSKCIYSHNKDKLDPEGWWNDEAEIENRKNTLANGSRARIPSNRTNKPQFKKNAKSRTMAGTTSTRNSSSFRSRYGEDYDWDADMEEREQNMGFTNDEVDELACQGVKFWDDDAGVRRCFVSLKYEPRSYHLSHRTFWLLYQTTIDRPYQAFPFVALFAGLLVPKANYRSC